MTSPILLFEYIFIIDYAQRGMSQLRLQQLVKLPSINSKTYVNIQDVLGVKVNISGYNSRSDAESKSHIHVGPICNGAGVMSF
jgi:hypothetical protein